MSASETAKTTEIEITPEMIKAGSRVMESCYLGDGRYVPTEAVLAEVYRMMDLSKPKKPD